MVYLPPATKLGQGYVFTGVCDSVHGGGVPNQVHPPGTRHTPPDQVHPPRPATPPPGPGTSPPDQGDTVYARAVRILLECNLVQKYFAVNWK